MATAEQLKTLIKSHFDNNDERFKTVVLQLVAHEAKQGHTALAQEIRNILDKSKSNSNKVIPFHKELNDLLYNTIADQRLSDLVVAEDMKKRIERILQEFKQRDRLKNHGLNNRRKILLSGPPGTGKTLTAAVLAGELHLPFCTILMDKLVTKFMGETSAKLRQVFEIITDNQAVYLFDEFDAIGSERSLDNDVGEMRRVLNAFLQFIEKDDSDSLIIAATNNPKLLDQALFRRFDDVLHYNYPTESEAKRLIENRLNGFTGFLNDELKEVVKCALTLSHAEITMACNDAIKEAVLNDLEKVDSLMLIKMLEDRKSVYHRGEN